MDELQKGDDGVYKCRVDFNLAQTSITRVRLTVIGKFNKKCIYFRHQRKNITLEVKDS